MNQSAAEIVYSAAVIQGELRRLYLTMLIALVFAVVVWVIQEFGSRKSTAALGWIGMTCLGIVASFAVILIIALI